MKKYTLIFHGYLNRIFDEIEDNDTERSIERSIDEGYINFDDPDMMKFIITNNTSLVVKDESDLEVYKIDSLNNLQAEVISCKISPKYLEVNDELEFKFVILLNENFDIKKLSFNKFNDHGIDLFSIKYEGAYNIDTNEIIDWEDDFDFQYYMSTWSEGYHLIGFED